MEHQRIYLLDEQALKDLKALRHEAPSDPGRSAWKGFSGNPPYPLAALVNLYDHIYALRSEVDALEVQRAVREANLDTFLKARDATEKRLRQAEDLLKKSAGKESAVRARRQRDLSFRNEVNSEGALAEDVAQLLAAEKIRSKRKGLQSLEEQYRSAEVQSPLSRDDLDRKLLELDARRKDQEMALAAAIREERSAKTALEKDRTGGPITAGPTERIRLETASSKIGIYQGSLKILNFEEALWQDRYRLGQGEDLGELREKRAEVDKALKQLGSWKEAFGKNRLLLRHPDRIRKREAALRNAVEGGGGLRPLPGRRLPGAPDPLGPGRPGAQPGGTGRHPLEGGPGIPRGARRDGRPRPGDREDLPLRLREAVEHGALRRGRDDGHRGAEDRTTVQRHRREGRKGPHRPAGRALGARRVGDLLKRLASRRYGMDASRISQMERKWAFFSFLLLLAFSLALVNIPLAVFAFFGGILAIGIGFGAQHLIGNFISSVILMFDRTISLGDIVEMEGQFGRVKSIGLRKPRASGGSTVWRCSSRTASSWSRR